MNSKRRTPMVAFVLESMVTCPACGHTQVELMPVDACQYFYECTGCRGTAEAEGGGLLRVLLVRYREMPTEADRWRRVRRRIIIRRESPSPVRPTNSSRASCEKRCSSRISASSIT